MTDKQIEHLWHGHVMSRGLQLKHRQAVSHPHFLPATKVFVISSSSSSTSRSGTLLLGNLLVVGNNLLVRVRLVEVQFTLGAELFKETRYFLLVLEKDFDELCTNVVVSIIEEGGGKAMVTDAGGTTWRMLDSKHNARLNKVHLPMR